MEREKVSKVIKVGGFSHVRAVQIGGGFPVVVQTMWKDRLSFCDLNDNLVKRIDSLSSIGCGLLRFAVPDLESAEVLGRLAEMVSMPLVADIHFDYKIALRCMDFPIAKIRINPGNIGTEEKVRAVLEKAAGRKIPIRIGVNAGSLPQSLRKNAEDGGQQAAFDTAEALVLAAEMELAVFDKFGFTDVLVSMKASGIADTIKANRLLSRRLQKRGGGFPLHLGVTEAGPLVPGVARNTAALVLLLSEGIGDTIRVSLSDTMENEIIAGREIVRAAQQIGAASQIEAAAERRQTTDGKLKGGGTASSGVNIVSCPRCGRHGFDTHGFTSRWLQKLYALDKDITVAIMGCEVNGPQEAKHADLGITGAGNKVLIFKHGKIIKTIDAAEADKAFEEELGKI